MEPGSYPGKIHSLLCTNMCNTRFSFAPKHVMWPSYSQWVSGKERSTCKWHKCQWQVTCIIRYQKVCGYIHIYMKNKSLWAACFFPSHLNTFVTQSQRPSSAESLQSPVLSPSSLVLRWTLWRIEATRNFKHVSCLCCLERSLQRQMS